MAIRVRVLNGFRRLKNAPKKIQKEPVILTDAYVRELNEKISYNIVKNQVNSEPDVFTLKKTIMC